MQKATVADLAPNIVLVQTRLIHSSHLVTGKRQNPDGIGERINGDNIAVGDAALGK